MIPNISPPTDNLYKFIALFGLGIFILSILNQTKHRTELINSKIEVEKIQQQIFDTIQVYQKPNLEIQQKLQDDIQDFKHVDSMFDQLNELEDYILKSDRISMRAKNEILTKINIIEIRSEALHDQERLNLCLMLVSIGLIIVGFALWYIKEQRWKDMGARSGAND